MLDGFILAAGDDGARAALEPLVRFGASWAADLDGARALVAGTSQSDAGFAKESALRLEAARARLPIACVEDFPGNYRHVEGAPAALLAVEGEFSARLYRERLAGHAPPMAVVPPARYDALRGPAPVLAASGPPWRVLWAGQPETESCLATLGAVAPFLASPDVEFLVRAHPRDPGHPIAYRPFLERAGIRWTDVSATPLETLLRSSLALVVTQYSSVAVEAGFAGVPSLHVLLAEAGGRLLYSQKGYRVPMPCDAGAAFLVTDPADSGTLERALRDAAARAAVIARFREIYHADTPQAARLAASIAGIIRPR